MPSIQAMYQEIETREAYYVEHYDVVPDFRLGVHAGPVVMKQVGEEKQFLSLSGDVVNVAACLE